MTIAPFCRRARLRCPERALFFLAFVGLGCDAFGVKRAYMALDSEGNRRREAFYTDTTAIFCVAELASGIDDLTVTAELHQLEAFSPVDGTSAPVDATVGVGEVAPGAGEDVIVAFGLERASSEAPYVAGRYRCDLSLNGEREAKLEFRIDYPDCPMVPIEAEVPCAGFVLAGASCEDVRGNACVCGESGAWECP